MGLGSGVTGAGCRIWNELVRGVRAYVGVLAARTEVDGGWAEAVAKDLLGYKIQKKIRCCKKCIGWVKSKQFPASLLSMYALVTI